MNNNNNNNFIKINQNYYWEVKVKYYFILFN
jgi:hypothetical protein